MNTLKINIGKTLSREEMKQITGGVVWCVLTGGERYACAPSGLDNCGGQCIDTFGDECAGCYEVLQT